MSLIDDAGAGGTPRDGRGGGRGSGRSSPDRGAGSARGARGGSGRRRTGRTSEGRREVSPRPTKRDATVDKPDLPPDRPRLARDVFRDIKAAARDGTVDEVCTAFAVAGDALAEGRTEEAVTLLRWAKSVAARSAVIREALGVAYYREGNYEAARSELQAYRRIADTPDQNHLLADCFRAEGRSDKVEEYVDEMLTAGVPVERAVEGVIVLAGDRADAGDIDGALAALDRVRLEGEPVGEPHLRLWYMAADLHARRGDQARERAMLQQIAEVDPDFLDAAERLS